MGHRYYDSRIGRFLSQDPAGDGDNWYAYAGNDPVDNTDPEGLWVPTTAGYGNPMFGLTGAVEAANQSFLQANDVWLVNWSHIPAAQGFVTANGMTWQMNWAVPAWDNNSGMGGGFCNLSRNPPHQDQTPRWVKFLQGLAYGATHPVSPLPGIGPGPAGEDWAKVSGIVREARLGKGNFGLGEATHAEADAAGKAWVGAGYKVSSNGKAWVSQDGLRQFRPPSYKPNLKNIQANLEQRSINSGAWQSNGHITIVP